MKRFIVLNLFTLVLSLSSISALAVEVVAPDGDFGPGCSSNSIFIQDAYSGCLIEIGGESVAPPLIPPTVEKCRSFCADLAKAPKEFLKETFGADSEKWISAYKLGVLGVGSTRQGIQEIPMDAFEKSPFSGYFVRFETDHVEISRHRYQPLGFVSPEKVNFSFYNGDKGWRVHRRESGPGGGISEIILDKPGVVDLVDLDQNKFAQAEILSNGFKVTPLNSQNADPIVFEREVGAGGRILSKMRYQGRLFQYEARTGLWGAFDLCPALYSSEGAQTKYEAAIRAGKKVFKSHYRQSGIAIGDNEDLEFPQPAQSILTDASIVPAPASASKKDRDLLARVYKNPKDAQYWNEGQDYRYTVVVELGGTRAYFRNNGSKRALEALLNTVGVERVRK